MLEQYGRERGQTFASSDESQVLGVVA